MHSTQLFFEITFGVSIKNRSAQQKIKNTTTPKWYSDLLLNVKKLLISIL